MWADAALGIERSLGAVPRQGARFQWLNRDLAAGASQGAAGALAALAAAPFAAHSMWDLRDPGPAVRYLLPEALRRIAARTPARGR
jgi:hypothetical protein